MLTRLSFRLPDRVEKSIAHGLAVLTCCRAVSALLKIKAARRRCHDKCPSAFLKSRVLPFFGQEV